MRESKIYSVYILANKYNTVLYVGVTGNLQKRLGEHQEKLVEGFTKRYNVYKLVYYEATEDPISAITREKQIKKWSRKKKNALISSFNRSWKDLSTEI